MTMPAKPLVAALLFAMMVSPPLAAQTAATQSDSNPAAEKYTPSVGQQGKDVVWVPTSQALVDRMLEMAELTADDRLVDLGSGDGRLVITAAKRGAVARGIEFNPDMVAISKEAAKTEGVTERAVFEQADIFESDFSDASVVTLFLLPSLNLRLRPTLLDMKPGTRVVSNSFAMEAWEPDESVEVKENCTNYCHAYKWIVPAQVAGTWKIGERELELKQTFQMLDGTLSDGTNERRISNARLNGASITFSVDGQTYSGQVDDKQMRGTIDGKTDWTAQLVSMQ
ncbi:SAM-dependent methyltransferase [Advenella mimigardefordensis]|uniref:Putative SAM-dependent methyltransferase n=1 Tax=Advenella mimigardefordensis (strain DSM 17166 / LMG 22922 / DPN7) TaxID=1247726 RepID=W0P8Q9_ADVMD|nr:class I SAM-dependent methyltransferase [Advenella mimigardefordensis]AHG63219.1 putative SAM-dependent methyltransferase [Advenella mimigardefordensis DPN7]